MTCTLALPSKSLAQSETTWICNVASNICRSYVNTHLLFFTRYRPNLLSSCICPLRGFSMYLVEALHCFSDVNPCLERHTPTSSPSFGTKSIPADVSFTEFSICSCLLFIPPDTWRIDTFCINQLHGLSHAPSTGLVSASNVISSFSTSILIVQFKIFNLFASLAENPMCPVCFTSNRFLKDLPKVLQLLPSCHYTEVVNMTQPFEISVVTAEGSRARDSNLHGTLSQHFWLRVSPNWRCVSGSTHAPAKSAQLALLLMSFRKICVNPPASFTVEVRSRHIPRCHLERTVCMISIVMSSLWVVVSVSGPFDLSTDQSRTALLTLHLVHPLQLERLATVVVALFLIVNFEHIHLPHVFHFFFSVLHSTTSGQSMCRHTVFLRALWSNHIHLALDLQNAIPNSDRTISNHLAFDSTQHCYHMWCKILGRCFWLSRCVGVSPVTFPSAISTWNFSNFLGTCEPSCLLPHEFSFVIRSSSLQTPATHRTINAMHSRVADKGLNLRHFPARGILGMFTDKMLLHFHPKFVSLYASSDLWLKNLLSQFADFLWFHTRVQQRQEVITRWPSHKKFELLSILHSSEFRSVIFKAEVPHCSVGSCSCQIHCEPFTESQPRCTRSELRRNWVLLCSRTHAPHSRMCRIPWSRHR